MKETATPTSTQTMTGLGMPRTSPLASHSIASVGTEDGEKPPVSITIRPRSMTLTPSVKIIDGTRR